MFWNTLWVYTRLQTFSSLWWEPAFAVIFSSSSASNSSLSTLALFSSLLVAGSLFSLPSDKVRFSPGLLIFSFSALGTRLNQSIHPLPMDTFFTGLLGCQLVWNNSREAINNRSSLPHTCIRWWRRWWPRRCSSLTGFQCFCFGL